jgi:heme a synthase
MILLKDYKYSRSIRAWLLIGLVMLIGQVVLGGITRLTGSGLSITSWDIITGVIPPFNKQQWIEAFEQYKQTPQFQKINSTFTLRNFKIIYFWEYFHRLWVRTLGIIFLIPFIIFLIQKKIDLYLIKRLAIVVALAGLTASAGWIMVQSGLIKGPWVDAYKLTLHFILAILTIAAMVKTIADVYNIENKSKYSQTKFVVILLSITFIQLILAGLMSGMRAGLYYPTWPLMNGKIIPEVLLNPVNWKLHNLTNYDQYPFAPAMIQFLHRLFAYILMGTTIFYYFNKRNRLYTRAIKWLTYSYTLIIFQVFFGILILLKIKTKIPIFYGVLHQLTGLLFFISLLFLYFSLRKKRSN